MRRGRSLEEKFWAGVKESDGCWEWQGRVNKRGYGEIDHNGKSIKAHRVSYDINVERLARYGHLVIDHLCLNPQCVRPDHLELVEQTENLRRSTIYNSSKTHCPRGHEYAGENISWDAGRRKCRTCVNARQRDRYSEWKTEKMK